MDSQIEFISTISLAIAWAGIANEEKNRIE
jgi:hypothetical protein